MEYCQKYEIKLDPYFDDKLFAFKKKPLDKLANSSNEELIDPAVFDLLGKMLRIDHIERVTAGEALMHPYFEAVR